MADDEAWFDKQGDVWRLGEDGLMHSYETAPFPREYVEKKWGPLRPVSGSGWRTVPVELAEETNREYHFNGDEADEVWMDRP